MNNTVQTMGRQSAFFLTKEVYVGPQCGHFSLNKQGKVSSEQLHAIKMLNIVKSHRFRIHTTKLEINKLNSCNKSIEFVASDMGLLLWEFGKHIQLKAEFYYNNSIHLMSFTCILKY